jgi:hypothetical protein
LASWIKMAEAEPGSPTIMQQLRQLEEEKARVEEAIRLGRQERQGQDLARRPQAC